MASLVLTVGSVWWYTREGTAPTGPARIVTATRGTPSIDAADPSFVAERLPPAAPDRTLFITRNSELATPDRTDVLPNLSAALAKAKPGQTLTVLDGQIEEQVTLDGAQLANVRLESGIPGGRRVTWRPPADASKTEPLLRLVNADGVAVRGFTFDGANRVDTLIHASGDCPDLTLSDLYLTDSLQTSLVFADCVAPPDRRLTVERVRFTTVRDYHEGASLMKERNGPLVRHAAIRCFGADTTRILIRYCRIEGLFRTGVRFEGPADAEVSLCRFYTLKDEERPPEAWDSDAVFVQMPETAPVGVALSSNTVARFTNLLHVYKLTVDRGNSHFALRSNLMIGGEAFVVVDTPPKPGFTRVLFDFSAGNVARPQNCNRGLPVIDKTAIDFSAIDFRLNTDHFLRYERSGDTLPLLKAGADGEPAGVPPID